MTDSLLLVIISNEDFYKAEMDFRARVVDIHNPKQVVRDWKEWNVILAMYVTQGGKQVEFLVKVSGIFKPEATDLPLLGIRIPPIKFSADGRKFKSF